MIYHICSRQHLIDQLNSTSSYSVESLASEGFIHCSTFQQVSRTLGAFFKNTTDLVLLHINQNELESEKLIFEDLMGEGQVFPHYYAPIPFQSIERMQRIPDNVEGRKEFQFEPTAVLMVKEAIKLIGQIAKVPSYSSYEKRLHRLISNYAEKKNLVVTKIPEHNLLITCRKSGSISTLFTAHLDKINHFADLKGEKIPFELKDGKMKGLLDDAIGVGISLTLLSHLRSGVAVALSEMEESTDLKLRPEVMKNKGLGLEHGIGAKRISKWMKKKRMNPELAVTIDVTPKFGDQPGIAVYSRHWEFNKTNPDAEYQQRTQSWLEKICRFDVEAADLNNTNDYLTYGEHLQPKTVSLAIEPAVHHYHSPNEEVFVSDVQRILRISLLLADYSSSCSSE